MPRLVEDRDLLLRFRAGERHALADVYRIYAPGVSITLTRGFTFTSEGKTARFDGYPDPREAADALNEVFRRAFEPRARSQYDGLRPYAPYLRQITHHLVIDRFRGSSRERPVGAFAQDGDASGPRADPLDAGVLARVGAETAGVMRAEMPAPADVQIECQEMRSAVRAFVDGLDAELRRVVQLQFEEGQAQHAAAKAIGWTRPTLRIRERTIRARLLEHLRDRGLLDDEDTAP